MIIDSHVHVFTDDRKKYPQIGDTGRGPKSIMHEQGQWELTPIERLIKLMDEAGIARATIVQAYYVYEFDNRYAIDAARAYPDRLISSVVLDPLDPKSPDELSRLVESEGVTAVRFMRGRAPVSPLGEPATFPMWERIQKLKVPLAVSEWPDALPQLRRAIDRYPDVKVAIEHIWGLKVGAPPYPLLDNLFAFAKDANIYVKFAINNILAARENGGSARPLIEKLVRSFGANRLMWCSNYPAHPKIGGYKERLEVARQEFAFLSEDERAWLFEKTVRSVHPDIPA